MFPEMGVNFKNKEWLSECAILVQRNDKVLGINYSVLMTMSADEYTFRSIDTVQEEMAVHL